MFNEKVGDLLKVLKECLEMLREFQGIDIRSYRNDRKVQDIVEREFERAIMACIDIGARLISLYNFPTASSYAEVFEVLNREGVLPWDISDAMADFARFRNVLVHEYFRIDPKIVHSKLQNLDIFRRFARAIVKFLEERCPSES